MNAVRGFSFPRARDGVGDQIKGWMLVVGMAREFPIASFRLASV